MAFIFFKTVLCKLQYDNGTPLKRLKVEKSFKKMENNN